MATTGAPTMSGRPATRAPFMRRGDDQLPAFTVRVLDGLLAGNRRPDPTEAYAAAGQAIRGKAWASYRAGRASIATLAGVYLNWLAPPADHTYMGVTGADLDVALSWSGPAGTYIDVVSAATARDSILDKTAADTVNRHLDHGRSLDGSFLGVRVLALGAPTYSLLVGPDRRRRPLNATDLWFTGAS